LVIARWLQDGVTAVFHPPACTCARFMVARMQTPLAFFINTLCLQILANGVLRVETQVRR
jgi:hypothetical protein